ncbi:MAG: DUF5320 domain-containing protein [Methanomassiliicoccales archaeon]|nr:DUF5320 domain-containing protein [Methanomassiliicoccales archaeon]
MPYKDGTGPMGAGPIGRGMGPCYADGRTSGMGFGIGRSRRGGFGGRCYPAGTLKVDQRQTLEMEMEMLENRLKVLKDQLSRSETYSP